MKLHYSKLNGHAEILKKFFLMAMVVCLSLAAILANATEHPENEVKDKTTVEDVEFDDPSAGGFFAGVLGGYRLPVDGVDMSAFASVSLIGFGDFKDGNDIVEEGHASFQIKIGIEVGLPFSK